ncbi:MAG: phosphoribosyl-ATP diphosphatase, partial [Ignisphaera sp.]
EKKPTNSYTVQLVSKGIEYVARKFGEESIEVIVAALTESRERFISEVADLLYHLLVLMVLKNITPEDIAKELLRRRK